MKNLINLFEQAKKKVEEPIVLPDHSGIEFSKLKNNEKIQHEGRPTEGEKPFRNLWFSNEDFNKKNVGGNILHIKIDHTSRNSIIIDEIDSSIKEVNLYLFGGGEVDISVQEIKSLKKARFHVDKTFTGKVIFELEIGSEDFSYALSYLQAALNKVVGLTKENCSVFCSGDYLSERTIIWLKKGFPLPIEFSYMVIRLPEISKNNSISFEETELYFPSELIDILVKQTTSMDNCSISFDNKTSITQVYNLITDKFGKNSIDSISSWDGFLTINSDTKKEMFDKINNLKKLNQIQFDKITLVGEIIQFLGKLQNSCSIHFNISKQELENNIEQFSHLIYEISRNSKTFEVVYRDDKDINNLLQTFLKSKPNTKTIEDKLWDIL